MLCLPMQEYPLQSLGYSVGDQEAATHRQGSIDCERHLFQKNSALEVVPDKGDCSSTIAVVPCSQVAADLEEHHTS